VPLETGDASLVLGRESLVPTTRPGLAVWRKALFILMSRNAPRASDYYGLPSERVLEIGIQIDL
jgi:KUP system potassium uptake protein